MTPEDSHPKPVAQSRAAPGIGARAFVEARPVGRGHHRLSRRAFLGASGLYLGGLAGSAVRAGAMRDNDRPLQPFRRYGELLDSLRARGHALRILGHAPDGSPVVAVRSGGQRQPAILISAGSHATEQAGVTAAVELIDRLDTEHELWVLPTRDPIGLNGFAYALGRSLGEEPSLVDQAEIEALLRERGELLHDADGMLLALIGECGYATRNLYRSVERGASCLEPLKGRRIYFPSDAEDMPGAGPLERAYTLVVTPEGDVLHLNRFHDTPWAPVEVRCVRKLMAEIRPGLTFDLHEYGGDAFWLSARRQRTDDDEIWERRMASQAARAAGASGARLAAEDYSPGAFFDQLERGVYWLDPGRRGEGLNLVDFACRHYGPGFTIETGMRGPFEERVRLQTLVVQAAVDVFHERYAKTDVD